MVDAMSGFSKTFPLREAQLGPDEWAILDPLTYTAKNGDIVECAPLLRMSGTTPVTLYFVTDLGSIPAGAVILVGDRAGKITLASIIHDWLYRVRKVLRAGVMVDIDEAYADDLLYEMCRDPACSENVLEADATYAGVRAGGGWVWNARAALDLSTVTAENPTEDFVVL
jgi:hypothetical protein